MALGTTRRCLRLLSRPLGSTHSTSFVSQSLSMQFVNCDFVVLFCSCNIYCTSVCQSEERDRSSEVFSIFVSPLKRFYFLPSVLTRLKGLRTGDVVHCTDCKAR